MSRMFCDVEGSASRRKRKFSSGLYILQRVVLVQYTATAKQVLKSLIKNVGPVSGQTKIYEKGNEGTQNT